LPLQRFIGDALFQVGIGMDGVHFVFGRAGTIAVEGRWELVDSSGALVDLDSPRSLALTFATGHRLKVYDGQTYESFHIYPDGIHA